MPLAVYTQHTLNTRCGQHPYIQIKKGYTIIENAECLLRNNGHYGIVRRPFCYYGNMHYYKIDINFRHLNF